MELGEPDDSGRCRPVPIKGSVFELECDLCNVAVGSFIWGRSQLLNLTGEMSPCLPLGSLRSSNLCDLEKKA